MELLIAMATYLFFAVFSDLLLGSFFFDSKSDEDPVPGSSIGAIGVRLSVWEWEIKDD